MPGVEGATIVATAMISNAVDYSPGAITISTAASL